MNPTINCTWKEDMAFEADMYGHKVMMDAAPDVGGKERGPRSKQLLLAALGGCTGMDVISILKKMRVVPDYFNMKIHGELAEDHPKYFTKIHLIYEFRGKDLPMDKLEKAVNLSQERYCAVSAMVKKSSDLSYEIQILD